MKRRKKVREEQREKERVIEIHTSLSNFAVNVHHSELFILHLKAAGALACSDPGMGVMGLVGFLCADSASALLIPPYTKSLS